MLGWAYGLVRRYLHNHCDPEGGINGFGGANAGYSGAGWNAFDKASPRAAMRPGPKSIGAGLPAAREAATLP